MGRAIYDPYGGILTSTIPLTVTDRLFTGQRWDATIGLYDYNARFYDPETGTFIQPDSIVPDPGNPMAWNRFAYVYNDPVNNVDPSGHFVVAAIDTAWDAGRISASLEIRLDLYSDLRHCFGDSDSMACYMAAAGVGAIIAGSLEGPSNNVARRTANAADDSESFWRAVVVTEEIDESITKQGFLSGYARKVEPTDPAEWSKLAPDAPIEERVIEYVGVEGAGPFPRNASVVGVQKNPRAAVATALGTGRTTLLENPGAYIRLDELRFSRSELVDVEALFRERGLKPKFPIKGEFIFDGSIPATRIVNTMRFRPGGINVGRLEQIYRY